MCVSLNTNTKSIEDYKSTNSIANRNLSNEPLNLNLPEDLNKSEIDTQDQTNFSIATKKGVNVPNVPVFNNGTDLRLTEFSPNSAKFEFGKAGEKPLITLKATNEDVMTPNGMIQTNSKASIKSPYLEGKAKEFAKEAVMENVVEPLRNAVGKNVADTTLGVLAVTAAVASAKSLPDGNFKVSLPMNKIVGETDFNARVVMGYGDGKSIKPTGIELSNKFEYGSQNVEVKARYRKDGEVNGIKGVQKTELDILVTDQNIKETSGSLAIRFGHDKVQGTSAGLFYTKNF